MVYETRDSRNGTPLLKDRFHANEAAWLIYGLDVCLTREEYENCFEGHYWDAGGYGAHDITVSRLWYPVAISFSLGLLNHW